MDNIEDKSFAAQRSLIRLSLAKNKISDLSPKVARISKDLHLIFIVGTRRKLNVGSPFMIMTSNR